MGEQRELLAAKLRDCLKISLGRPCFLGFLDESQAAYCQDWLRGERTAHLFWGGYEEAQRVMLGFFSRLYGAGSHRLSAVGCYFAV